MLHIWMCLLLPKKGRACWCYIEFASCCFLNSSLRLLLQTPYPVIQTIQALLTFETDTVIATCFLLFSISLSGRSCREHKHLPKSIVHPTSILPTTTGTSTASGQTGKYLIIDQVEAYWLSVIDTNNHNIRACADSF
jgi:hypothetical protein